MSIATRAEPTVPIPARSKIARSPASNPRSQPLYAAEAAPRRIRTIAAAVDAPALGGGAASGGACTEGGGTGAGTWAPAAGAGSISIPPTLAQRQRIRSIPILVGARVAEPADAPALGAGARKGVGVRIPPLAREEAGSARPAASAGAQATPTGTPEAAKSSTYVGATRSRPVPTTVAATARDAAARIRSSHAWRGPYTWVDRRIRCSIPDPRTASSARPFARR